MKLNRLFVLCAVMCAAIFAQSCCCNDGVDIAGDGYKWQNGMIVFDEPARVEGQESMLGFAAELHFCRVLICFLRVNLCSKTTVGVSLIY